MPPINRKTAHGISRGGPSKVDLLGGDWHEGSLKKAGLQAYSVVEHRCIANQYRDAAQRNAEAGRELGGQHGFALLSLAEHFTRRAHQHAVAAGGAS